MAENTKIEWADATWNIVTGCTKVSAGCKHCYAEREWARLSANPKTSYYGRKFTDVQCHPERLDQPLRWTKPRKIFPCSMGDLFHESVPFEFIDQAFAVMALSPQHTFIVLTKRADRMYEYMTQSDGFGRWGFIDGCARKIYQKKFKRKFPQGKILLGPLPNVWLGATICNQEEADRDIPKLLETPAAVRFLSIEPMLGPMNILKWLDPYTCADCEFHGDENDIGPDICEKCGTQFGTNEACQQCGADDQSARQSCPQCGSYRSFERDWGFKFDSQHLIDWVIVGGESGPKARPMHPQWVRDIRDQCAAADVPFLFKQWGEWAECHDSEWHGLGLTGTPKQLAIGPDGRTCGGFLSKSLAEQREAEGWVALQRVGKKRAGRLLDGVIHDAFPEVAR